MNQMTIEEALESAGDWAHGGNIAETAEEWSDHGFTPEQVQEWLEARVFEPYAARRLRDAGVTPELAATGAGPEVGLGGYSDTYGYMVSNGDLLPGEAADALLPRYE